MTDRQDAWLRSLGPTTIFDRTANDEILERAQGKQIILTTKCAFDEALPARLLDSTIGNLDSFLKGVVTNEVADFAAAASGS